MAWTKATPEITVFGQKTRKLNKKQLKALIVHVKAVS